MRDIGLDWKCKHWKFICRLFLVEKEKQMCIKFFKTKGERKRNRCPLKKEKKEKKGEKLFNPWVGDFFMG